MLLAGAVVLESIIIFSVEEYHVIWLNDKFRIYSKRDSGLLTLVPM